MRLVSQAGGNSFAFRQDYHGVFFAGESHHYRNIVGPVVQMQFEIVDKRRNPDGGRKARYAVTVRGSCFTLAEVGLLLVAPNLPTFASD